MNRDKECNFPQANLVRRLAPKPLTTAAIQALKPGKTLADGAIRPGYGSLKIRKRQALSGVVCEWLFEWSRDGKTSRHSIGRFCITETTGSLTLSQARAEAGRLQSIVKSGNNPLAVRQAELEDARTREKADKAKCKHAKEKSLAALLAAYVENLREKGKDKSAYDAQNIFANHILIPFPELAALPAAQITAEHFSKILARLVRPEGSAQKGRTALKLRSYAAAAYKMALGASIDPMAPSSAHEFGLTINPVSAVPATKMAAAFNRVGERVLSADEMAVYLCSLAALNDGLPKLALQLQIVTCGQRMQQLLRLTHADISNSQLTIYDPKGKRLIPRAHILPILPEVDEVLTALRLMNPPSGELGVNTPLFLSRGAIVSLETISGEVQKISMVMCAEGSSEKPFRAGDIRRTVETMLAEKLNVSKDLRAQLLSHGLSGVQDRHYDKGLHLSAKSDAMRMWNDFIADLCIGP